MDVRLFSFFMLVMSLCGCVQDPYVIVQVADAQLGFAAADRCQREGVAFDNDVTYERDCLLRAVDFINALNPDAVVFTGDQVNYPDIPAQWEAFDEVASMIDKDIKVFHIPGNHDVIIKDSGVDSSPFTNCYGDDRFVHSERGVKMVGINTNLIQYDDSMEYDQIDWLEAVLEKPCKDDVTILFGHHPFFMTDIDEPDSYFPIKASKRHEYFELFSVMDVDAVYAGHRHETYEAEYDGIPMKTTTSVAYQIGNSRPSVRVITIKDGAVSDELHEI